MKIFSSSNIIKINSVYEFVVGEKVWEVFSTKDWELFALIFHKRCMEDKDRTKVEGIKIKSVEPHQDGRKRLRVNLPSLDWVLLNLHKGRPKYFPMKKVKNEYHVPQYLNFSASLMNAEKGSDSQDLIDNILCKNLGTAKLVCLNKPERTFTVIIYGTLV